MKETSEPSGHGTIENKNTQEKVEQKEKKTSAKSDPFAKYGDIYSHSWPRGSKAEETPPHPQRTERKNEKHTSTATATATAIPRRDEAPDVIEIRKEDREGEGEGEGEGSSRRTTTLVKVHDDYDQNPDALASGGGAGVGEFSSSHDGVGTKGSRKSNRKAKRNIKIMESPLVSGDQPAFSAPTPSKPTKYYKPPRASGKSALDGSPSSHRGSSGDSYATYAGSSSPATFKGLLRGMARLLTGSDEDLTYYKANYSATGHSPDVRSAKECSRKADRRAGRTTDLYTEENKKHWRMQCQMRAQERDIEYVRDMQVVYKSQQKDEVGDPIVIAIGAHYSKRMIPREDMLLHITKEVGLSKMNEKPYSVVYCHSNVELPKKPAVGFFKSLHAALGGDVCSNHIKAIYVIHPTPLLRTWMLAFQIRVDPTLFKKVVYVPSLKDLKTLHPISSLRLEEEFPSHVRDCENK